MTGSTRTALKGPDVGIPPRRLEFRVPDDLPRWFYGDNATSTLFFTVLSAFFPPGEAFFVESVRRFRDRIADPELQAEVSGFVGQETIHSREHGHLNDALRDRGIDVDTPERLVALALSVLERLPARQQLVCTAFMEHFTALLAEELLTDEHFRSRGHSELLQLWLWHALEELEHKAVTYDVYEAVGNRRPERLLAAPLVATALVPALLGSWVHLLVRERVWQRPGDVGRGIGVLFGRRGFVTRILPRMSLFLRPDFHPARHDTSALEAEWRDALFGKDGTLRDQVRHLPTS